VRKLAESGVCLTLVTFEKPHDLRDQERMDAARRQFGRCGVRWVPLRYHKRPRIPATAFDMIHGWACGLLQRLSGRFDVIHARTFIGGLIGLALSPWLRTRLIYHNEGFYPDEQVDAGVWGENSLPHLLAKRLEQRLYERAQGIIVLSQRARTQVCRLPEVERRHTPVVVVPSCVDLERFVAGGEAAGPSGASIRLVYLGSVGGRYRLDQMARFAAVARRASPALHLRVLSPSDPELVAGLLQAGGLPSDAWSLERVPFDKVPEQLQSMHAGLHFLARGLSEHGGSPTKIAEYLACGLPVVVTPNMGDVDAIVYTEKVGILIRDHSEGEYDRGIKELLSLLSDRTVSGRCRQAAEKHFGLEDGCRNQLHLYRQLTQDIADAHANCIADDPRQLCS
jgi:glycosyltransferase involved in cell wall biosynthesis